jgi:hypothetical protein
MPFGELVFEFALRCIEFRMSRFESLKIEKERDFQFKTNFFRGKLLDVVLLRTTPVALQYQ